MADRLPLTRNIRWFQLLFGAFVAWAVYTLILSYQGVKPIPLGAQVGLFFALGIGAIVFVVYLQNVYRFGLVPDYSMKCRFCNGPVNRYSEFCEHCGADLIAPEKLMPCPKCGVELYEGTAYCPECGARIVTKGKGKKGKKKPEPQEGWDTPIDATTGIPPPRREDE